MDAAVKAPLWSLSVLTGAKFFTGNPIIGGERLNRLGLHGARMLTAARLARHRRGGLTHRVSEAAQQAFERDGYVVKSVFPAEDFENLRAEILDRISRWKADEDIL